MGKIAIWIVVALAIIVVLRMIGTSKGRSGNASRGNPGGTGRGSAGPSDGDDAEQRRKPGELMMSCAVCGLHLPSSEAVFARGKVFCGPEHRDLDEARRDEP